MSFSAIRYTPLVTCCANKLFCDLTKLVFLNNIVYGYLCAIKYWVLNINQLEFSLLNACIALFLIIYMRVQINIYDGSENQIYRSVRKMLQFFYGDMLIKWHSICFFYWLLFAEHSEKLVFIIILPFHFNKCCRIY